MPCHVHEHRRTHCRGLGQRRDGPPSRHPWCQVGSGDGLPFDRVADLFLGADPSVAEPQCGLPPSNRFEPLSRKPGVKALVHTRNLLWTRGRSPPAGLPDDELSRLSGLPTTRRLPDAMRMLDKALSECFSPVAQHVSAGFQLHSCISLDAMPPSAVSSASVDHQAAAPPLPTYDLIQQEASATTSASTKPAAAGAAVARGGDGGGGRKDGTNSPLGRPPPQSVLLLASPQRDGSPLAERGVQLVLFRARWTLQDAVSPSWEVAAPPATRTRLSESAIYPRPHGQSKPGVELTLTLPSPCLSAPVRWRRYVPSVDATRRCCMRPSTREGTSRCYTGRCPSAPPSLSRTTRGKPKLSSLALCQRAFPFPAARCVLVCRLYALTQALCDRPGPGACVVCVPVSSSRRCSQRTGWRAAAAAAAVAAGAAALPHLLPRSMPVCSRCAKPVDSSCSLSVAARAVHVQRAAAHFGAWKLHNLRSATRCAPCPELLCRTCACLVARDMASLVRVRAVAWAAWHGIARCEGPAHRAARFGGGG